MKNMYLILTMFFLFTGCGQEEPKQQLDTNSIYGTWQLVEQFYYNIIDPESTWTKVSNGEIIVFYKNNMYYSSTANTCSSDPPISGYFKTGTTDKNYNFIAISLSCTEGTFNIKEGYTFENNYLILSPIDVCDEGCSYKYKKIAEPEQGD